MNRKVILLPPGADADNLVGFDTIIVEGLSKPEFLVDPAAPPEAEPMENQVQSPTTWPDVTKNLINKAFWLTIILILLFL